MEETKQQTGLIKLTKDTGEEYYIHPKMILEIEENREYTTKITIDEKHQWGYQSKTVLESVSDVRRLMNGEKLSEEEEILLLKKVDAYLKYREDYRKSYMR